MRQLIFLVLGGAIMLGLFLLFSPKDKAFEDPGLSQPVPAAAVPRSQPGTGTPTLESSAKRAEAPPAPPAIKRFRLEVGESGLVSGPEVIRVRQGEEIAIELASSIDDELHLHGYDRHLHLHAGETAVLTVSAELSGRFDYELHDRHIELGALEVLPR